jgi:hypothetical protein
LRRARSARRARTADDRDEVVALFFDVADIAAAAIGIETLLREDEAGGEEEDDEG